MEIGAIVDSALLACDACRAELQLRGVLAYVRAGCESEQALEVLSFLY